MKRLAPAGALFVSLSLLGGCGGSGSIGEDETVTLFEVPLPEREADGAILKPGTKTLRIQE